MRMDRLTSKLQTVLSEAQSLAVGRDHNYLTPAHVLAAMLDAQDIAMRALVTQSGADYDAVSQGARHLVEALPVVKDHNGDVSMSPELLRMLNLGDKFAQQRSDEYISAELVLLAATRDSGDVGKLQIGRAHV